MGYFQYPQIVMPDIGSLFSEPVKAYYDARDSERAHERQKALDAEAIRQHDQNYGLALWSGQRAEQRAQDEYLWKKAHEMRTQGAEIAALKEKADRLIGGGNPEAAKAALGDAYWFDPQMQPHSGLSMTPHQEAPLPELQAMPTRENQPPELKAALNRGSALSLLETPGDKSTYFDRPPSEEEFGRFSGGPGNENGRARASMAPGEEGPIYPPAEAAAQERIKQTFENPDYRQAAQQYIAARNSYPERRAAAEEARAAEESRRSAAGQGYDIAGGPGGQAMTVYTNEARQRNTAANTADAASWATQMQPTVASYAQANPKLAAKANAVLQIVQGEIASGQIPAKGGGAAFNAWMMKGDAAIAAEEQARLKRLQAEKNAHIMAGSKAGRDEKPEEFRQTFTMNYLKDRAQKESVNARLVTAGQFKGLIGALNSNVGADQKLAIIAAYRQITGDNRLSDSDRDFVMKSMGTRWEDMETQLNAWGNNKLAAGQVKALTKALKRAEAAIWQLNTDWGRNVAEATSDTSIYDPRVVASFVRGSGLGHVIPENYNDARPPPPRKGAKGGAFTTKPGAKASGGDLGADLGALGL